MNRLISRSLLKQSINSQSIYNQSIYNQSIYSGSMLKCPKRSYSSNFIKFTTKKALPGYIFKLDDSLYVVTDAYEDGHGYGWVTKCQKINDLTDIVYEDKNNEIELWRGNKESCSAITTELEIVGKMNRFWSIRENEDIEELV
jgi:hypothetical protein